jgi:ribosome-binding protein aMBF1 (putative translation factor)
MIMSVQTIKLKGQRFVMLPEAEYKRLERLAAGAERDTAELPALPKPDAGGNYPALQYIKASIARDIIRERKALGLTQAELAARAGLRQETLSRLESGKHSPTVRTVEKIDRALQTAARQQAKRQRK